MTFLKIVFLFSLVFCAFTATAQLNLYVSPNGNDSNKGTVQKPVKTLSKAMSLAEQAKGQSVKIQLRKGTYYAGKTLILNASETSFSSLEITGYQNETAIIDAGHKLSLSWKPFQKGIYQAVVPPNISFEQLFINGQLQHLARYPNYDANARVFHGTAPDAIAPERVKTWKNPTGGYIHALHSGEWGGFHYLITGKVKGVPVLFLASRIHVLPSSG